MSTSKIIIILLWIIYLPLNILSQDYFEDANGNGVPIISGELGNLLSARANTSDNSIKVNLFANFILSKNSLKDSKRINIRKTYMGIGLYVKGKAENGISNLFKSGDLQEGFNVGGYISVEKFYQKGTQELSKTSYFRIIFIGMYSYSNFNLYNPRNIFSQQLYDTSFAGYLLGISAYYIPPLRKGSLILGFSVTNSKTNNYASLDKYEVKEIQRVTDSSGTITKEIIEEKDSYSYAVGQYEEFNKYKVKLNFTYVPGFFDNKVSFIIYPSSEYSLHKYPLYNLGLSVNFLKDGIPVLSVAGLTFEFNDISNITNSKKKFIDRSLKIGLNAALNIFGDKSSK